MIDTRKTLQQLKGEWDKCTSCELGRRRLSQSTPTPIVWGTGVKNGIMFIGEGPGREEEIRGEPFIGPSGKFLRQILAALKIKNFYITNVVSCRSCSPMVDGSGNTVIGHGGLPKMKDEAPLPTQIAACLPRLLEEIYLVDPVVIVTLGGKAAEALTGRPITITQQRGEELVIEVPGAAQIPHRTDKKQEWLRKTQEGLVAPTVQNTVEYLVVPTLHPAYVLRSRGDLTKNGTPRQFVQDIKKAKAIYERYQQDACGVLPAEEDLAAEEATFLQTLQGDSNDPDYDLR